LSSLKQIIIIIINEFHRDASLTKTSTPLSAVAEKDVDEEKTLVF